MTSPVQQDTARHVNKDMIIKGLFDWDEAEFYFRIHIRKLKVFNQTKETGSGSITQNKLNLDYFKDGLSTAKESLPSALMSGKTENIFDKVSNFFQDVKRGEIQHVWSI